jgi:hypothetical protein
MQIPNEHTWPGSLKFHIHRRAGSSSMKWPHKQGRISERTALAGQALPVRYLAQHCRLL